MAEENEAGWWDQTTQGAEQAWDTAVETAGQAAETVTETAQQAWDTATETAGQAAEAVTETAQQAWDTVTETAQQAWDSASETAGQVWDTATDTAEQVWDTVVDGQADGSKYLDPGLPWPSTKHPTHHYVTNKGVVTQEWLEAQGYVWQRTDQFTSDPPHYEEIWVHPQTGDVVHRYVSASAEPVEDEPDLVEARGTCEYLNDLWQHVLNCREEALRARNTSEYPVAWCEVRAAGHTYGTAVGQAAERLSQWHVTPEQQSTFDEQVGCVAGHVQWLDSNQAREEMYASLSTPTDAEGNFLNCAEILNRPLDI
jgi:hypothetical protein